MADELKSQSDLVLKVPAGLNAHLLVQSWEPPKADKPIEKVGYWLSVDPKGETGESVWFAVNGDLAAAQAVINSKVAGALEKLAPEPEPKPVVSFVKPK